MPPTRISFTYGDPLPGGRMRTFGSHAAFLIHAPRALSTSQWLLRCVMLLKGLGMRLKKLVLVMAVSALLSACATSYVDSMVESKAYAGAFYSVSLYHSPAPADQVKKAAQRIKDSAGANFQNEFLAQTLAPMNQIGESETYFLNRRLYIDQAKQTGLLSEAGAEKVERELERQIAGNIVLQRDVSDRVKRAYPNLDKQIAEVKETEFQNALHGKLKAFADYAGVFRSVKEDSPDKAQMLLPQLRKQASSLLAEDKGGSALKAVMASYAETGDAELRSLVVRHFQSPSLRREQLNEFAKGEFAEIIGAEAERRETRLRVTSESDDPFVDELAGELPKFNEWISIDDQASRTLSLSRLRFSEREGAPAVRTQTVSQLDFATLLFIPRNASVLFDYTTTKYDLNWSMSIRDSHSKKSKVIAGKRSAEKVECSNLRYRNVFGGEGVLDTVPPVVQEFCSRSNLIRFEAVRESAVGEIAKQVADFVRYGGDGS